MGNKFEEIKKKSESLKKLSFQHFWTDVVECSELMKQLDPNQRRPWIVDVICQMYEEQAGRCALTGHPLDASFEVDHIVPVSYGGGGNYILDNGIDMGESVERQAGVNELGLEIEVTSQMLEAGKYALFPNEVLPWYNEEQV